MWKIQVCVSGMRIIFVFWVGFVCVLTCEADIFACRLQMPDDLFVCVFAFRWGIIIGTAWAVGIVDCFNAQCRCLFIFFFLARHGQVEYKGLCCETPCFIVEPRREKKNMQMLLLFTMTGNPTTTAQVKDLCSLKQPPSTSSPQTPRLTTAASATPENPQQVYLQ